MTSTYRRDYPTARWEVVELAGEPVGLLITHVGDRGVTYVNIALLPRAQRRGLATRVIARALDEPRRLGLAGPSERAGAECGVAPGYGGKSDLPKVAQTPPFVGAGMAAMIARPDWRSCCAPAALEAEEGANVVLVG